MQINRNQYCIKSKNIWKKAFKKTKQNAGATLEISIHGFTILLGSDFMSNFMGSSAKILEIHGFTGTQGTRPNAAPEIHLKSLKKILDENHDKSPDKNLKSLQTRGHGFLNLVKEGMAI